MGESEKWKVVVAEVDVSFVDVMEVRTVRDTGVRNLQH